MNGESEAMSEGPLRKARNQEIIGAGAILNNLI
jgi:hypothetical protein